MKCNDDESLCVLLDFLKLCDYCSQPEQSDVDVFLDDNCAFLRKYVADLMLESDTAFVSFSSLLESDSRWGETRKDWVLLYRRALGLYTLTPSLIATRAALDTTREYTANRLDSDRVHSNRVTSSRSEIPLSSLCRQLCTRFESHPAIVSDSVLPSELVAITLLTLLYQHVLRLKFRKNGRVSCILRKVDLDPSYLEALILGTSTGVRGLDFVLGGGGLILGAPRNEAVTRIPVRHTCIFGGPGTGKTSMLLSILAGVAESGGVAIFSSLDSGSAEPEYLLSALGKTHSSRRFHVVMDINRLVEYQRSKSSGSLGMLALLSLHRDQVDSGLTTLLNFCRIIVDTGEKRDEKVVVAIDPLNSMLLSATRNSSIEQAPVVDVSTQSSITPEVERFAFRDRLLAFYDSCADLGVNTIASVESDQTQAVNQIRSLADTAIDLTYENRNGMFSRNLIVSKSRRQRECSGMHSFDITSTRGIRVFPNLASVAAADRKRQLNNSAHKLRSAFGLHSLDLLLDPTETDSVSLRCSDALTEGDIVLVRGPVGTFKTHLALTFLHWFSHDFVSRRLTRAREFKRKSDFIYDERMPVGLVVSMRVADVGTRSRHPVYRATISNRNRLLSRALDLDLGTIGKLFEKEITTCLLPGVFIGADEFIELIDESIDEQLAAGKFVDRVLLDSPSDWEDLSTGIAAAPGFTQTLLEHLRRRRMTVLVTDRFSRSNSSVLMTVNKMADTIISLRPYRDGAKESAFIRIVRSHFMKHDPNEYPFEATSSGGLRVARERDSLRLISESAPAQHVDAKMLLPIENNAILKGLEAKRQLIRLSTGVDVDFRAATCSEIEDFLRMSAKSKLDDIQLVAIEAFQVRELGERFLREFPSDATAEDEYNSWLVSKSDLEKLFNCKSQGPSLGLLYHNVSCLVVENTELTLNSWDDVFHAMQSNELAFSYVFRHKEDLNTFYLEFLNGVLGSEEFTRRAERGVDALIEVSEEWHRMFRVLAKVENRVLAVGKHDEDGVKLPKVTRHWNTTIPRERLRYGSSFSQHNCYVTTLPHGVITNGDWYAGVSIGSSSIRTAFSILGMICSPDLGPDEIDSMGHEVRMDHQVDLSHLNKTLIASASSIIDRVQIYRYSKETWRLYNFLESICS